MRVLDFIRRADVKDDTAAAAMKNIAEHAIVLAADNVALWYDAHVPQTPENQRLSLFDRCVPPFDVTSVEFAHPTLDAQNRTLTHAAVIVWRMGEEVLDFWRLGASFWFSDLQRQIALYPAMVWLDVSRKDGAPNWDAMRTNQLERNDGTRPEGDPDDEHVYLNLFFMALLAFRFTHAKNVRMVEQQAPRHERRRAEREGKPAPVSYRTLEIAPITKRLETEGHVAEVGLARALHLCRGHFADYTTGAGLFGKYKVEVFVPEHLRGRRSKGLVIKDYAVGKPNA